MNEQPRHIYGPVVVEKRRQKDGSIKFEVWDNCCMAHYMIESFDSEAKAETAAKKLTDARQK